MILPAIRVNDHDTFVCFTVDESHPEIADQIEVWFRSGAADGFNVMPPLLPESLDEFVDRVIPVLQRRGLVRTRYTADTLRGHLGLERPTVGAAI